MMFSPLEPPVVHAQGVVAGGAGVGHLVADIQTARNAGKTAETARGAQDPIISPEAQD